MNLLPKKWINHPYAVTTSLLLILGSQGCDQQPKQKTDIAQNQPDGKAVIMTVSEPIKYMVGRITDDSWASVEFPAAPTVADPAYWKPSPDIIRRYQDADLVLLNGGDYAKWISGASLKQSRLQDTSSTFKDRLIMADDAVVHQHGPEGTHSHEGYATTTWLDFELAGLYADSILRTLKKQWPEHGKAMEENHTNLKREMNLLHENMLNISKQIENIPLLASHPVYQYIEKAYNLNIHSLHWEPDATPAESEWQALDAFLSNKPIGWMIWEDTPTEQTQELLKERNIKWLVFRPQGGTPKTGDFLTSMHQNLDTLKSIIP